MKTLALLSLSLAVALGMPKLPPGVEKNPALTKEDQSPLVGDLLPVQGHVVVEDPVAQVGPGSEEKQEKGAPVPVALKQGQSVEEVEVKVKPEGGEKQEGGANTEDKKETELKNKPEAKVEEVKKEDEVKVDQEVKEEQGVKEEDKVKVDQEVKEEQEVQEKDEVKVDQEVKEEQGVQEKDEVKVEQEVKEEQGVQEKDEVKVEQEVKEEQGVQEKDAVKVDQEVKEEQDINVKPEVESELEDDPDFMAESPLKVEPELPEETEPEEEPMFDEEFQVQMNLEPQTEMSQDQPEDTEAQSEMVAEPLMELEPLNDDDMSEEEQSDAVLSELEKSVRAAFLSHNEEPIMELEPETGEAAVMEEGPALDIMGQQVPTPEDYFPNEEAVMGMKLDTQQNSVAVKGSDGLMMEEPGAESVSEEEVSPETEDSAAVAYVQTGVVRQRQMRTGQCSSLGVPLEGKCYQFFSGPKSATDAEFFCQRHFHGGHLASITSQHIHRELMNLMLQQHGAYTRTWIGGLRYLETGRFIWLDGSQWGYADWLSGEPNNTADLENCVEVLAHGNGKFNDFTCWEPQAFICSYPDQ